MAFALFFSFLAIAAGAKIAEGTSLHEDYLSRSSTASVNGIFVLFILLSHASSYLAMDRAGDELFVAWQSFVGQLMVAPFLFFSGYGMMCSVMQKGAAYTKGLFTHRFLRVFLHFLLALTLFGACVWWVRPFTLREFGLALTTWGSIGNSNWYVTAILSVYLCFILSNLLFARHKWLSLTLSSALILALPFLLRALGRPSYTYNTIPVFVFGMWYAALREKVEALLFRNRFFYLGALSLSLLAFALLHGRREGHFLFYSAYAAAFCAVILLVSLKVKFQNPLLSFLGRHVFSIYLLQRIPMIVFDSLGLARSPFLYFFLCAAVTLLFATAFDALTKKLDRRLFGR